MYFSSIVVIKNVELKWRFYTNFMIEYLGSILLMSAKYDLQKG